MRRITNLQYVSKVGKVYVTTLTDANTWYQVLTEAQGKGIRGFKVKARQTYDSNGNPTLGSRPFDYAFKSAPDSGDSAGNGYYSASSGSGDEGGPCNGLWARSSRSGTVIEVLVYE